MPDIRRPATESRLDLLRRKLYNREATGFEVRRSKLFPENYPQPETSLESEAKTKVSLPSARQGGSRWLSYFLIGTLGFFLVALALVAWSFLGGASTISGNNINLLIKGPIAVRSGDETDLQIVVENKNSTALRFVDIVIEYPAGTRSVRDVRQVMTRDQVMVGDINPGETVNRTMKAIVFGGEGSNQNIKVSINYRIPGSEVIFQKKKDYSLAINSSPINITVDAPAEVEPSQSIELKIKTISNSEALLRNVLLTVAYPPGFEFASASVKPSLGNNVWSLGDVQSGDAREIVVRGVLAGASEDVRTFRVTAGSQDDQNIGQVLVAYGELFKTVAIKQPYLAATLTLNKDDAANYILPAGQTVRAEVSYKNNFSSAISNVGIKLNFDGSIVDRRTVSVDKGFYDSSKNEITWDKNTEPSLGLLAPGDKGVFAFTFSTLKPDGTIGRNPTLGLKMILSGNRTEEGFVGYPTQMTINKLIKIQSALQLATRSLYNTGAFENSGPIPPAVGESTSYTIVWTISNSSSDMNGVEVRGRLPQYVKWLGNYAPTNEVVNFNPTTGEVVWRPGYIKAGTGSESSSREVSFQVLFTPSLSQKDLSPVLVDNIRIGGVDSFTGVRVNDTKESVTTERNTEPGFTLTQSKVVAP